MVMAEQARPVTTVALSAPARTWRYGDVDAADLGTRRLSLLAPFRRAAGPLTIRATCGALDAWRASERSLAAVAELSPEWLRALADVDANRATYHRLFAERLARDLER